MRVAIVAVRERPRALAIANRIIDLADRYGYQPLASSLDATVLGLDRQLGRIAAGQAADIVLVAGDPLAAINDARNVVAVIRNGRFFSAIGLIERARGLNSVE